jgi:hypothetical protein
VGSALGDVDGAAGGGAPEDADRAEKVDAQGVEKRYSQGDALGGADEQSESMYWVLQTVLLKAML